MDIEASIKALLGTKTNAPQGKDFDRIYHERFEISGMKKAQEVLADIQKRPELNTVHCAYFSIGGSTGSEIFHAMRNSDIKYGVLLEYSPIATDVARKRQQELKRLGKELVIITGDAMQQLKLCKSELLRWRNSGQITGLIASAQAVLHELPFRSPHFDINHFIGEIAWDWDPFLFYSREPCGPRDWPNRVEIRIPGVGSELLETFTKEIRAYLRMQGQVSRSGPEWVGMPAVLAIETITKIFYLDDYTHEIEERVTSMDPDTLRAILENCLGGNSTSLVHLTSESFKEKYRQLGIQARQPPRGERLFIPQTFAFIVAERITDSHARAGPAKILVETNKGEQTGSIPTQFIIDKKATSPTIAHIKDELSRFVEDTLEGWKPSPTSKLLHVRDSVQGDIGMQPHEVSIMEMPVVRRLHLIRSAGLAFYVYPGMHHTRFEHSLGTLEIAQRMLNAPKVQKETASLARTHIRLAALLHDIGSLPFSHLGEFALEQQFSDLRANLQREAYLGEPRFFEENTLGEIFSYLIVTSPPFVSAVQRIISSVETNFEPEVPANIDLEYIGRLIISRPKANEEQWHASIINGPFGANAIDYLMRDLYNSGLLVRIDLERLLNGLSLVQLPSGRRELSVDSKSIFALEEFLLAKFHLWSRAYTHHRLRAIECTFRGVTEEAVHSGTQLPSSVREWFETTESDLLRKLKLDRGKLQRCLILDKTTIAPDAWSNFAQFISYLEDPKAQRLLRRMIYEQLPNSAKTTFADLWIDVVHRRLIENEARQCLISSDAGEVQSLDHVTDIYRLMATAAENLRVYIFYSGDPVARQHVAKIAEKLFKEEFALVLKPFAIDLALLDNT